MRESDFVKRHEIPYMTKGRWYRAFIESDGNEYKLTNCDLKGCMVRGTHLALPVGFHVLNVLYDITFEDGASVDLDTHVKCYANGRQAFNMPDKTTFTDMYVYFYGYQAERGE